MKRTEGKPTADDCDKLIEKIRHDTKPYKENTMRTKKLVFYRDKKGEYRWRTIGANGKVTADSGEGYKTLRKCCRGFSSMFWYELSFYNIEGLRETLASDNFEIVDMTKEKKC
jgi:uncharacterized protein YegP (UPF0339 family)